MRIPPKLGEVDIAAAGATDRTRMPNVPCSSVTIQAKSGNAGSVYVGDHGVTNAIGAKVGIELAAGDVLNNVSVDNLNALYLAADNAHDKVRYLLV